MLYIILILIMINLLCMLFKYLERDSLVEMLEKLEKIFSGEGKMDPLVEMLEKLGKIFSGEGKRDPFVEMLEKLGKIFSGETHS